MKFSAISFKALNSLQDKKDYHVWKDLVAFSQTSG